MDKLVLLVIITSLTSAMEEATTDNVDRPSWEAGIKARYPGYFKTEEELKDMQRLLPTVPDYHGCCISYPAQKIYPRTMENASGANVTIVEFKNGKQAYATETCITYPRCSSCNCNCSMASQFLTAVVYDSNFPDDRAKVIITYVNVQTFCRCYNIGGKEDETKDDEDKDNPKIPETSHDNEL